MFFVSLNFSGGMRICSLVPGIMCVSCQVIRFPIIVISEVEASWGPESFFHRFGVVWGPHFEDVSNALR